MKRILWAGVLLGCIAGWGGPAEAAGELPDTAEAPPLVPDTRWQELFRPFQTEIASLSPDGNYLAYSFREGDSLSVVIVDAAKPEHVRARVVVGDAKSSSPILSDLREQTPARIQWMGWPTDKRLIVETNRIFGETTPDGSWRNLSGAVIGMDADGAKAGILVTPKDVAEEAFSPPPPKIRVRTPDDPAFNGTPKGEEESVQAKKDRVGLPTEGDTEFIPKSSDRTLREPRILDYAPDPPGSVLVTVQGSRGYDVYRLDAVSGKLKLASQEVYEPDMLPLPDRQGRERIVLRASLQTPFPRPFQYESGKLLYRWSPVDRALEKSTGGGFSVSPENFFSRRAIPLGFSDDPDVLFYASNDGRDTFGIYAANLRTGEKLPQALEHPHLDLITPAPSGYATPGTLVYDRFRRSLAGISYVDAFATTLWVRPEFEALQRRLEKQFSGRSVTIQEWDRAERRFLVFLRGPTDAGAFALLDTKSGKLIEFARRAPWLDGQASATCLAYSFPSAKGHRLSGTLILPRSVRVKPAPVVVYFAGEPWTRTPAEFQPEAEAFASLGLAVLQVDGRGTWGFGLQQREHAGETIERARIEDVLEVLDALAAKLPISTKKVALVARGRNAYLALRAVQLQPERIRCVIALEPTVDIPDWIGHGRWVERSVGPQLTTSYWGGPEGLRQASIFQHQEPIRPPVLFLSYRGPRGGERTQDYIDMRRLRFSIENSGTPTVLKELEEDYVRGLPAARAAVFRDIEEFLNLYLYEYTVKVGETKPVKD